MKTQFLATLLALTLTPAALHAQKPEVERPAGSVVDFLQPIEADPLLQHSKEVYVRNGCAYCHGVDLRVRNGEAADLMHSSVVAGDVDGNVLGALLRHGIPQTAKLSPMPQFSDLSDRNVLDIARWIHHARQQGHVAELAAAPPAAGDQAAGEVYFKASCGSCHTAAAVGAALRAHPAAELPHAVLLPVRLNGVQSFKLADLHDDKINAGRAAHAKLAENISTHDWTDLSAWLLSSRAAQ
jgi:mono/diheme cytochrome c family protein